MKKSESRSHDPSPRPHSDSVSVTGNRCAVTVIREPNKHSSQYKIEFSSPAAPTLSPVLPGELIHNLSVMSPVLKPSVADYPCFIFFQALSAAVTRVWSLLDSGLFAPT